MKINVYSQELTSEVKVITKTCSNGMSHHAASLILHSSNMLHNAPDDDDRSAVTFWLPSSKERREDMARAFESIANVFREVKLGEADKDIPGGATHKHKGNYFRWAEFDRTTSTHTVSIWVFNEWNVLSFLGSDEAKINQMEAL